MGNIHQHPIYNDCVIYNHCVFKLSMVSDCGMPCDFCELYDEFEIYNRPISCSDLFISNDNTDLGCLQRGYTDYIYIKNLNETRLLKIKDILL